MRVDMRREPRNISSELYSICWQDQDGNQSSAQVQGMDISDSGVRIQCPVELRPGTLVFIQGPEGHPEGYGVVRHCTRLDANYIIGLEFDNEAQKPPAAPVDGTADYYEFLQISPRAEFATIHRIYRFLAGRYHPDNPETGDPEKFLLLRRAFEVLSNPERRAAYDASRQTREAQPIPAFASVDFMAGVEGELNRRMAVLSLLYHKRRTNALKPSISLYDMERHMAFPREYLDFATWYLRNKKYITVEDNSAFALTALGVDYVETNLSRIPMLNLLLNGDAPTAAGSAKATGSRANGFPDIQPADSEGAEDSCENVPAEP